MPPDKYSNKVFAELLTLKLNVAASVVDKFPVGFGELTFYEKSDPANPFNGQLISTIIQKADTMISCLPLTSKPVPPTMNDLYSTIEKINGAFSGPIDTVSFAAKTRMTGVKQLLDVPFLRKTPGIQPVSFPSYDIATVDQPEQFTLNQNYPNPFNPTTTIEITLASASTVSLKVYNMLGQEVAVLINSEEMEDGDYHVEFNAANLSSGVYMYRLTARPLDTEESMVSYHDMKKMVLIR